MSLEFLELDDEDLRRKSIRNRMPTVDRCIVALVIVVIIVGSWILCFGVR